MSAKSHEPVEVSFVFGGWVECAKCGVRLYSEKEAGKRCPVAARETVGGRS